MDTHRLGARFEDEAARWLEERGWIVVARNVRFRRKELDLVVRHGATIAFVEVKGRRGSAYGHPAEAVTWKKRREIESVARWWIEHHPDPRAVYRFDVLALAPDGRGGLAIEHIEDAWRLG